MNCRSVVSHASSAKACLDDELVALITRARAGDLGAQSELVRRYSRRITGFIRRIVVPASAVEDVVQTVFIKMARRIALLREPRLFENWLFALARNAAVDFIRRRRSQPATVHDELRFLSFPDSDSGQAVAEINAALERALARLSEQDRKLVQAIVAGHSYNVVAKREGISVSAVKIRIHRVRPFLRWCVGAAIGAPRRGARKVSSVPRGRLAA